MTCQQTVLHTAGVRFSFMLVARFASPQSRATAIYLSNFIEGKNSISIKQVLASAIGPSCDYATDAASFALASPRVPPPPPSPLSLSLSLRPSLFSFGLFTRRPSRALISSRG